jgi:hypothetical protein
MEPAAQFAPCAPSAGCAPWAAGPTEGVASLGAAAGPVAAKGAWLAAMSLDGGSGLGRSLGGSAGSLSDPPSTRSGASGGFVDHTLGVVEMATASGPLAGSAPPSPRSSVMTRGGGGGVGGGGGGGVGGGSVDHAPTAAVTVVASDASGRSASGIGAAPSWHAQGDGVGDAIGGGGVDAASTTPLFTTLTHADYPSVGACDGGDDEGGPEGEEWALRQAARAGGCPAPPGGSSGLLLPRGGHGGARDADGAAGGGGVGGMRSAPPQRGGHAAPAAWPGGRCRDISCYPPEEVLGEGTYG